MEDMMTPDEQPKVKNIDIAGDASTDMGEKLKDMVDKLIKDEFTPWSSWRQPFESIWDEIYRLYFSSSDSSKTPTRAKMFVPVVFQIIEAAVPKVINVLFNGEEFFDVVPTVAADEPMAKSIKVLLLYQLGQAGLFMKFIDFTKQLFLYGTSYFYVYWKVKRQWVFKREPVRSDVSFFGFLTGKNRITDWKETKEYKVVEKRPELEVLDILDVFPDPDAKNETEGKALWVRSFIDIDELKDLGKGQFPVYDNTESEDLKGDSNGYSESRKSRYATRHLSSAPSSKQVELLTRWGLFDLDGDGIREETCIVIANRKVLIKAKGNPFHHQKRPIIRCPLFVVPNEWYGIGLVEPIIPLQHEINTLRRQRLDNINIIINRMWLVNEGANVDLDTLISSPNGVILTNDMAGVQPLVTPDVTQSNYLEAQNAMLDIENTTISKAAQGTPSGGSLGRTAKGAQLIVGQALEKFGVVVRLIEEIALKRILRMFHQLNLQMIDDDETLRDPGLYGHIFDEKINAEMIRAEVKFKMLGVSEMIGKEGKINQAISYMGVFGNFIDGVSITAIAKKVWELMGFDPSEIEIIGATNPQGNPPAVDQQTAASVAGQVAQNGATTQPSIPGVNLNGGQ